MWYHINILYYLADLYIMDINIILYNQKQSIMNKVRSLEIPHPQEKPNRWSKFWSAVGRGFKSVGKFFGSLFSCCLCRNDDITDAPSNTHKDSILGNTNHVEQSKLSTGPTTNHVNQLNQPQIANQKQQQQSKQSLQKE